jgi:hypothetical protein
MDETTITWLVRGLGVVGFVILSYYAIKNRQGMKLHTKYGDIELGDEDAKIQVAAKMAKTERSARSRGMGFIKSVAFGKILRDCIEKNPDVNFYEIRHKVGESIINTVEKKIDLLSLEDMAKADEETLGFWISNVLDESKAGLLEERLTFDAEVVDSELGRAMKMASDIQKQTWAEMHPTGEQK